MYKRAIYRFTEDLSADVGFGNYEQFKKGTLVTLDDDFPWKYCILCNEDGDSILDEDEDEIFLDWRVGDDGPPVWEGKVELVREGYRIEDPPSKEPFIDQGEVFTILFHKDD